MKSPIFISGLRKSGTSMVKNLLDSHPGLFVFPPNELHFFRYSYHPSMVKDKTATIENPGELLEALSNSFFITRMSDKTSAFYLPDFKRKAFDDYLRSANVQTFREVYLRLYEAMFYAFYGEKMPESLRCVSKTVLETEFFPELHNMFPDLKFIYVLRHPYAHFVSAVKSMRTHTGKRKDRVTAEGMKLHWFRDPYPFLGPELNRMRHSYYFMEKFAGLYPDQFYILVYDNLLLNPEQEMKNLCRFLDINFDPVLLKPTILGEPWGGNSWTNESFSEINTKPLHQWRKDIAQGEIRLINKYFGALINRFFAPAEKGGNLFLPFHPSEYKPWVYVGNRMLYYWTR
ncbi:MAG: sulfotransferase [Bacteroidales bacterium]|nr:sulfotransferase [Bacteroidales bacterium]